MGKCATRKSALFLVDLRHSVARHTRENGENSSGGERLRFNISPCARRNSSFQVVDDRETHGCKGTHTALSIVAQ